MATLHRTFRAAWLVAASAALMALAGCGESSKKTLTPIPPPVDQATDINSPTGGYNATPEEPGFGDATLAASTLDETVVEDALEQDADVRGWMFHPGAQVYALSAVWGMLQNNDDPSGPSLDGRDQDWSGRIESADGAILLRSVISFERADGDSVLTRSSRRLLEWKSATGEGHDGLRLLLVRQPNPASDPDRSVEEADSIYFQAGTYTRVITWRELASLDEELQIDGIGNRISLQAHRVAPTSAHLGGFLRGRWDPIAAGDSVGRFEGVWVGERGVALGLFHGIYGTNDAGERVFYGKYIDAGGAFLGILRGAWGTTGREPRNDAAAVDLGWFRGEWVNDEGARLGELNGRFRTPAGRPGFLQGRWCRGDCLTQP